MGGGISGDVVRVQDPGDHAFAACQQAATFMVRVALRMSLKREEHAVLHANEVWHRDQSISRRAEKGKERRRCYGRRNRRRVAFLNEIFQDYHRGMLLASGF